MEPESLAHWCVLRAQVEHHDRFTSQRDGCLDRLRDGKRSISFKVAVTVRYDAGIIDRFRASGDGWQTRMNDALRDWLKTHRV
ncbi:BrnA antitoxin family protein [Paraburkholderia sp. GAS82]|uniref:BrnA antitoxin family protein n=1 Tax=Paraburkholderia sp. GAS82 TaxID=3035137 RepID=UPI003D248692